MWKWLSVNILWLYSSCSCLIPITYTTKICLTNTELSEVFSRPQRLFAFDWERSLVIRNRDFETRDLMENKVFGQGGKVGETDKLNIDSIIARLLEGKNTKPTEAEFRNIGHFWHLCNELIINVPTLVHILGLSLSKLCSFLFRYKTILHALKYW